MIGELIVSKTYIILRKLIPLKISYGIMASSAVTGQSFCREMFAAVGGLITEVFYENVGYPWSSTILAIIGSVLALIPFAFYWFGPLIRSKSPYALALKNE